MSQGNGARAHDDQEAVFLDGARADYCWSGIHRSEPVVP